jgi:small subunit ribosomal protein S20
MPHTPSAGKRLRKSEKRRRQNRTAAKKIKGQRREIAETFTAIESSKTALATAKPDTDTTKAKSDLSAATAKAPADIKKTQEILDRAATKGYIHPNKAARLKSRLVKRSRALAK